MMSFGKKQDSLVKAVINLAFEGLIISLIFVVLTLSFCKDGTFTAVLFSYQGFSEIIIFLGLGAIFPLVIEGIIKVTKTIRLNTKNLDKYYENATIIKGDDNLIRFSYYVSPASQASNDQPLSKSSQHTVPEVAPETDNVPLRCVTGSPRANQIFELLEKEV